jgi:hypothetical protein
MTGAKLSPKARVMVVLVPCSYWIEVRVIINVQSSQAAMGAVHPVARERSYILTVSLSRLPGIREGSILKA